MSILSRLVGSIADAGAEAASSVGKLVKDNTPESVSKAVNSVADGISDIKDTIVANPVVSKGLDAVSDVATSVSDTAKAGVKMAAEGVRDGASSVAASLNKTEKKD